MAQERLSLKKIEEVLRLKWACGLSTRAAARSCHISHSTVSEYLARAEKAGLTWPLLETLDEDGLYRLLYPEKLEQAAASSKPQPDWEYVRKELKKAHVTKHLVWEEYLEAHPDGYSYSQFCDLYRRYAQKLDPHMRFVHKAGEKLFVDYSGDTVPITHPETGEVSQAEIFVATQGASNYTYAEAQPSQALPHWIGGHVRAHTFFGGVTQLVVPDNLKQGVKSACWYDPDINPTYLEWAQHYNVAVLPTRTAQPRGKAKVENAVLVVERWILARLRNRTFFNLADLNRTIRELLVELNEKPMQITKRSRKQEFEEIDLPALRPLPSQPYEFALTKLARVNIDYHIEYEKHYYSVPFTLIHEEVRIRATESMLEVFHKSQHEAVACHPRSHAPGRYSTQTIHMPAKHQKVGEWNAERLLSWAEKVGPHTVQLIQAVMVTRQHPEQAFRCCLGILRLSTHVSTAQMEAACRVAHEGRVHNYRGVKELVDNQPPVPSSEPAQLPLHDNIRGTAYYQ
jgi:transposase